MPIKRYSRTTVINSSYRGTATYTTKIFDAVNVGTLVVEQRTMKQGDRLDAIAGRVYGDATYWWVIAAASGIGWPAQVPPGTVLKIPTSLDKVFRLLGL